MRRRNLTSRIIAASVLSIALITLEGCAAQVAPTPIDGQVPTVFRPKPQTEPPVELREWAVRLRLFSVEVPVGMSSRSDLIWSYLDEEPIQAGRTGVLAANGFRLLPAPQLHDGQIYSLTCYFSQLWWASLIPAKKIQKVSMISRIKSFERSSRFSSMVFLSVKTGDIVQLTAC